MNKNKLARQHGFFSWDDLMLEARSARRLKTELRELRAKQAPLERAIGDVAGERVMLATERAALANAYRHIAQFYRERASTEERAVGAAKALCRSYEEHADEVETGKSRAELMQALVSELRAEGVFDLERTGE